MHKNDQIIADQFLAAARVSCYAEAASGLRHKPFNFGEIPERLTEDFDAVIRIGGVPTHRLWRDLEQKYKEVPAFHFSSLPYSGLAKKSSLFHIGELAHLVDFALSNFRSIAPTLNSNPLKLDPRSELGWVQTLSRVIPGGANVFLGNSLCIREWDQVAQAQDHEIQVNRGMNGIDGLIATFLGSAKIDRQNWLVLGDLSALYDLPSLQLRHQMPDFDLKIVVINNGGGKIFAPMFNDKNFENRHSLRFQGVATMFGWGYHEFRDPMQLELSALGQQCVVEILPEGNPK